LVPENEQVAAALDCLTQGRGPLGPRDVPSAMRLAFDRQQGSLS
jgi:hypothetical protein